MTLTTEQVEHIAELARLELSKAEISRYREQLSAILEFFEQLQTVDTRDVPVDAGVQPDRAPLREDHARPGLTLDELLQNAPDAADRQFRVPPIFE